MPLRLPIIKCLRTNYKNIDLIIPVNNKGKKAIALIYWVLTREVLKEKGLIKSNKEFEKQPSDFEAKIKKAPREKTERFPRRRGRRR